MKIALVDMDGVLCDYDSALQTELAKIAAPNDPPFTRPSPHPFLVARRRLIQNQPGFWRNLAPLDLGYKLLHLLRELNYIPHILTQGPKNCLQAWSEKAAWCKEYQPDCPIIISQDKSLVDADILVDDFAPYFVPWLQKRPEGLVICPAHPWNEMFAWEGSEYRPSIFRCSNDNLTELKSLLIERNK